MEVKELSRIAISINDDSELQGCYSMAESPAFVLETYKVCATFPNYERFGLCSQFQRAAVSISANIAEGYRRTGI